MNIGLSVLLLAVGIVLLYWLLPKGNILHEGLRIPGYNWKLQTTPIKNISIEKFKYGKHRRQFLLYIEPTQGKIRKDKIIVYYHGGGWMFGTPYGFILNATFFTTRGYTVIMPCYRALPFYRFKTIREDLNLGLKKIQELITSKKLPQKELVLGGMSAGANLAALIKYDQQELAKTSISQQRITGLMLFGGPLNLHEMAPTPLLYAYAGPRDSPDFIKASPIQFLTDQQHHFCPVLIIHGTKDGLVHYNNASTFYQQLKKLQTEAIAFHTIENGTHLDAGRWLFNNEPTKSWVENWLKQLS